MQNPSVGRIVHFNNGGTMEASLVVGVNGAESVNLVSWNAGGTATTRTSIALGTEPGTWQWPAKVDVVLPAKG